MDYVTQFRKIEKAYQRHMLSVECPHCNFAGTLMNNNPAWVFIIDEYEVIEGQVIPVRSKNLQNLSIGMFAIETEGELFYEMKDILELEKKWRSYMNYIRSMLVAKEEALHRTLCVTLNLLREIHTRKGELAGYIPLGMRESNLKRETINLLEDIILC